MYADDKRERAAQRAVIVMVTLFSFSSALLISTINVALPQIATEFALSAAEISWIPMIFILASAMFVMPYGRLADIFGRVRVFLIGLVAVLVTSILAALSPNEQALLIFRFLQGASAAVGFVTLISITSSALPKHRRGQGFGLVASAMYFGLAAGPAAAGFIVDYAGWRWSLLLHVPFMLVTFYIGLKRIDSEWQVEGDNAFDWVGASIYATAIAILTWGVTAIPSTAGSFACAIGAGGLAAFVLFEARCKMPLIEIGLFRTNTAFAYSCIASFLMYAANFSSLVLVSLYFQYLKEIPAKEAGLLMMANPLATALFAPLAGKLSDRIEPRFVATLGIGLSALGLFILAASDQHTALGFVMVGLFASGVGFCFFAPVNAHALMSSLSDSQFGTGSSSHASMRLLGQLLSMAIVAIVFALLIGPIEITSAQYTELSRSISICFLITGLLCVPAAFFSINRGRVLDPAT